MGVHSLCKRVFWGLFVSLLLVARFCHADDKTTIEVVGTGECADCKEYNIKTNDAFKGLRVTIDCKVKDGHFKTRGVGELDEGGKFKVSVPKELLEDGDNKEECYAQLHSALSAPCPAHNGLEATMIVAKSDPDAKYRFEPVEKLKFSSALCNSAFFWPHFKHPPLPKLLPLPKIDPWKHHFGHHFSFPPIYKKPCPPFFKKPQPPSEPKKPKPPSEPKKPLPPSEPKKPLPPPEPKKPFPPTEPKKPKPPAPKKPLPPSEPKKPKPPTPIKPPIPPSEPKKPKPPVAKPPTKKPFPPPIPIKKPCPPIPKIPKIPKFPKIPHIPKIPPKYLPHPHPHPYFHPLPPHIPKIPPKYFPHPHPHPYFPPLPPHIPYA